MNQNEPFENHVKRLIKEGKKTVGAWAQIISPISAEIMSRAGFDWLIIDMEHGPNDIPSLLAQMQAMKGTSAIPIVRAPWNDMVMIKRILDTGAYGVLIPYVSTREEAVAAARACKYPPEGNRGIAGSTRAAGFNQNHMEYLTKANDEILVIVQVENSQAVDNLDDILAVDGIDGIFIGPMDLSTNMGYLYNPNNEEVQNAIATIEAKVNHSDKFLATISGNWQQARSLFERGYQMVTLLGDGNALAAASTAAVANFRQEFPEG